MDREVAGRLLLGVDGGGASTQAVIATLDGKIIGRGLAPPSNHHRVGFEGACKALTTAIEGAFTQVEGLRSAAARSVDWTQGAIAAGCFGLAGVDSPADVARFDEWLRCLNVKFKVSVVNDAELVLGATPEGWGVALISGTGSICLGRNAVGETLRVGGWGHILGDEGSGYGIATAALKQATQAADGRGGSTSLLNAALSNWRLKDPKELIGVVGSHRTLAEEIASFAPRVIELAGRNDPSARAIVNEAAADLAVHVNTVVQRLRLDKPALALGGSMIRIAYRNAIVSHVKAPLGAVTVVQDPTLGAIAIARRLSAA